MPRRANRHTRQSQPHRARWMPTATSALLSVAIILTSSKRLNKIRLNHSGVQTYQRRTSPLGSAGESRFLGENGILGKTSRAADASTCRAISNCCLLVNLVHRKVTSRTVTERASFDTVRAGHKLKVRNSRRVRVTTGARCRDRLECLEDLPALRKGCRKRGRRQRQLIRRANVTLGTIALSGSGWITDLCRARD